MGEVEVEGWEGEAESRVIGIGIGIGIGIRGLLRGGRREGMLEVSFFFFFSFWVVNVQYPPALTDSSSNIRSYLSVESGMKIHWDLHRDCDVLLLQRHDHHIYVCKRIWEKASQIWFC